MSSPAGSCPSGERASPSRARAFWSCPRVRALGSSTPKDAGRSATSGRTYFRGLRIPRWFDEGYAQWASGGFDASEAWRLRVLIALGRAPPLDSLALTWPDSREEARSAYLLAASAVALLLEPAGERGLTLFFERWRAAGSFDDALRRTFGATPGQFEEDWKRHVRSRYGWLLVLSRSAALWAIMALVLLVMARVRRSRNRERFARLRASELPEAPAFWIEPDIERDIGPERGPPGVGSV
jgi:hypothetical protein